jgi:GxxExxY protein
MPVFDEDGTPVGEYFPDLIVAELLIVELKAARTLVPEHQAQLLGYLRCTRREHGMLIDFGAARLQVRKYALSSMPSF